MKEAFLDSRGIAYRTNDILPNRETLLFIHGLSGSLSVWYPFEEHFKNTYNVVTIDLRGHGKSKKYKRNRDYSLHCFAGDIEALIEQLSIKECILISHSLGGLVALEFLHKYPLCVRRAVFISPPANADRLSFVHLKHPLRALAVCATYLLSIVRRPHGRTNYEPHRSDGDWDLRRIFVDVSNTGRLPYLFTLNHLYSFSHNEWWGQINMPTLILHGSVDSMVPVAYAKELAKQIPNAQIKLLENKNHLLPMNSIKEVCEAIEQFVQ